MMIDDGALIFFLMHVKITLAQVLGLSDYQNFLNVSFDRALSCTRHSLPGKTLLTWIQKFIF